MGLIRDLAIFTSHEAGLGPGVMFGPRRTRCIAWPRFAVMKVANERGRSLHLIARHLHMGHHTSVIHGCRRAAQLERTNPEFADLIGKLRTEANR